MTLDELLQAARDGRSLVLARGILDLLGESQPCGFEAPMVIEDPSDEGPPYVCIPQTGDEFTPAETRAYAAMLLRAADEADALPHSASTAGGGE